MAANRLVPVNLRLPENLIRESDRLAEMEGSSRTEVVRNALRSYIEQRQRQQAAIEIVERRGKAAGIDTPEDLQTAIDEIRATHPAG